MRYLIVLLFNLLIACNICQAQTGILEDFNDNYLNDGWSVESGNFTLNETNEALHINAASIGGYDNFEFSFDPVDISGNQTVNLHIRTATAFTLRVDLVDDEGNITNSNPVTIDIPNSSDYQEINVDFSDVFANSSVNNSAITTVVFFFNPGGSFSGDVYFDSLSVGDPIKITPGNFVINQVGYNVNGPKTALFKTQLGPDRSPGSFDIIDTNDNVIMSGSPTYHGTVPGWDNNYYWLVDFSDLNQAGTYQIRIGQRTSMNFETGDDFLYTNTVNDVIGFFNNMRSENEADQSLSFHGDRSDEVDVSGGWWDATGDPGKHFSHLSYANYFNPQQIPMVVWSMLKTKAWAGSSSATDTTALNNEINFGVDYLMRNLDSAGYFYLSIFDNWGSAPESREICEWGIEGQNDGRTANYQCAMREGGGIAIAALARAARVNTSGSLYTSDSIIAAAEKAYAHLQSPGDGYDTKNIEYCNDHTENIIDDYTGLIAATELFKTTGDSAYLTDARSRALNLIDRQQSGGWLAADDSAQRPFFHAADEGFPIVALKEYLSIDNAITDTVTQFMNNWLNFYMSISENNDDNPYNYVKAYTRSYADDSYGSFRESFFIPHENETGYWWQGQNARLASMSTAIMIAAGQTNADFSMGTDSLNRMAQSQLDWILGENPFDVCMLYGYGENNYIDYISGKSNITGGICNGITAGVETPDSIAWRPYADNDWENWRWTEQWLPHDAWFLMAIAAQYHYNNLPEPPTAAISSPSAVCPGTSFTVNENASGTVDTYTWIIGNDTLQGPEQQVAFSETGIHHIQLMVSSSLGTDTASAQVNVQNLEKPVIQHHATAYCGGEDSVELSVTLSDAYNINWLKSDQLLTTQPTDTINVTSGTFKAIASFENCADTSEAVNIGTADDSIPAAPGSITGDSVICSSSGTGHYAIEPPEGATSYSWNIPAGAGITSEPDSNEVTIQFGDQGGTVAAAGVNQCGAGEYTTINVSIDVCAGINHNNKNKEVEVYPSPARKGKVHFSKTLHQISVYDMFGNQKTQKSSAKMLEVSDYPAGIYILRADEGNFRFIID